MGGRLTVRSQAGQGATFTVALTLPAGVESEAPSDAAPAAPPRQFGAAARTLVQPFEEKPQAAPVAPLAEADEADEAPEAERALRVLVVDDHAINRRAIQVILQTIDCEIAMAENGMAALRACETGVFDVIFMDVRMPELDGRETTRRLRAADGPNAATPVIAVTADSAPEDIAACLAAGMNHFVAKPLTPAVLLTALGQVLDGDAAKAEAAADAEAEAAA
ncbi:Chemotaxis protein CheY [compost metagenome]